MFFITTSLDSKNTSEYVTKTISQNQEFVILGLTGKIRSGTSDVCKLLLDAEFCNYATQPADTSGWDMSEIREHKIVYRYLQHNWKPFIELNVTSVIISFLLDLEENDLKTYTVGDGKRTIKQILEEILTKSTFLEDVRNNLADLHQRINFKRVEEFSPSKKEKEIEETEIDEFVLKFKKVGTLINEWKLTQKECLEEAKYSRETIIFCYGILPVLDKEFENALGKDNYTELLQDFGNSIRATGEIIPQTQIKESDITAEEMFCLVERINQFLKILRHYNWTLDNNRKNKSNQVFIVINSLKNIFEAFYFKKRYSAFFLVAVSCNEKSRQSRFGDYDTFLLTDFSENLSARKKLYKVIKDYSNFDDLEAEKEKFNFTRAENLFIEKCYFDKKIWRICHDLQLASFILQDIMTCIENADIFVTRDFSKEYKCDYDLIRILARIITLIFHPALLKPTKVERCMQIAMTAKLNSGCLSRQVGAVVTDKDYNILSLGWNDAPNDLESCMRRNLFDLARNHDPMAYSEYELDNKEFRGYLKKIDNMLGKECLHGLPFAFCFKDIYQDMIKQRDQIYTRALHGEERALAMCSAEQTKDGYIFTTSSPCELCAKKIKEAKIAKIYYIEQYPGISESHIINAGMKRKRAEYQFFTGAVGWAYIKLYTPMMSYKDELEVLGFSPVKMHKNESRTETEEKVKKPSDDTMRKNSTQMGKQRGQQ